MPVGDAPGIGAESSSPRTDAVNGLEAARDGRFLWHDPAVAAVVWLILGIVLIIAEVLSGDFVLIMLGGGALAAALSAALGGSLLVDALVFAAVSVALLLVARPVLRRRLHRSTPHAPTGVEALVGGPAVAVSRVDSHGGQVKIGGEIWSARSYDHGQVIEPGERVTVIEISGATAVVLSQA